jgi:hypothetical protein
MTSHQLQYPAPATGQSPATAGRERQEPASRRRDRWPAPALRPTVYCPSLRVHQCVTESR